jgi:SAM-dependent methyltransferase
MAGRPSLNLLYDHLASWWPLLSPPEDYRRDALVFRRALLAASTRRPRTVLELGSGGGNNASHMKAWFDLTLVDLSPRMLAISRKLNPECRHQRGDMTTLRLGRAFDAVFVHDAVNYMRTPVMLRAAIRTAFVHTRPGGVALFVPDWTRERFTPGTVCEGGDDGDRALRYLEWTVAHDPDDHQYTFFMSYLLREGKRVRQLGPDVHTCGLFSSAEWLAFLREAGFRARAVPYTNGSFSRGAHIMFVGRKGR